MSMYLNPEITKPDTSWLLLPVAISLLGAGAASAQLSSDDINTLLASQKNGADPHEIALAMSGVERTLRGGAEPSKLIGTIQAIDLAATIYRTRDTTFQQTVA